MINIQMFLRSRVEDRDMIFSVSVDPGEVGIFVDLLIKGLNDAKLVSITITEL